jgi:hypothetical protein
MPGWPRSTTLNRSSEETFHGFYGTLLWKSAQIAFLSACSSPAQTRICNNNYSPEVTGTHEVTTSLKSDTTDGGRLCPILALNDKFPYIKRRAPHFPPS